MSRFRSRGARAVLAAAIVALLAMAGTAAPASAHPLGNFTVNRAIRVEVGAGVTITAVLDLAEIPAFEVIRGIDADGDERLSPTEGNPYAGDDLCDLGLRPGRLDRRIRVRAGAAHRTRPRAPDGRRRTTDAPARLPLRGRCGRSGRGRNPRAVGDGSNGRRPNWLARGLGRGRRRSHDRRERRPRDEPERPPHRVPAVSADGAARCAQRSADVHARRNRRLPGRSCPPSEAPLVGPATWIRSPR